MKPKIILENNWSEIQNLPLHIVDDKKRCISDILYDDIAYEVAGARFVRINRPNWDAKIHLYKKIKKSNSDGKFLTGLFARVVSTVFKYTGIIPDVIDNRIVPEKTLDLKWNDSNFIIRDYQSEVISSALAKGRGVLELCTGSGKTVIASKIIQEISVSPFIFYVLTKDLMYQAKDRLESSIIDLEVGIIGDGKCDIKDINVMTIQTATTAYNENKGLNSELKKLDWEDDEIELLKTEDLSHVKQRKDDIKKLIEDAKGLFFDECHHSSSKTCQKTIEKSKKAYYVFGGSATPRRSDNAEMMIEGLFGRNIGKITASDLIRRGFLVKPDIYYVKLKNPKVRVDNYEDDYKKNIMENEERNNIIASIANRLKDQDYNTLILIQRIEHGNLLNEKIPGSVFIHGKTPQKIRSQSLEDLYCGKIKVLIGSSLPSEEKIFVKNKKNGEILNISIGDFTEKFLNKGIVGSKKVDEEWEALSLNKFNKNPEFKKITYVHRKERKTNIINVRTKKNFECLVTDNHSLITTDNMENLKEFLPSEKNGEKCIIPLEFDKILNERRIISKISLIDEIYETKNNNKYSYFSSSLSQPIIRRFKTWAKILKREKINKGTFYSNIKIMKEYNIIDSNNNITEWGKLFLFNLEKIFNYKYKCLDKTLKKRFYYNIEDLYKNDFLKRFLKIKICIKKSRDIFNDEFEITKDFCEFLGYYSSEGYMDKNIKSKKDSKRIILSSCIVNEVDTKYTRNDIEQCLIKLGIKYNVNDRQFIINNSTFYNILKDVFDVGIGFYEKKIPRFIYNLDIEKINSYIYGIIMGDGSLGYNSFRLHTSSFHLSRDFILLLRIIGYKNITVKKRVHENKKISDNYSICVLENYKIDKNLKEIIKNRIKTKRKLNYSNKNKFPNGLELVKSTEKINDQKFVYDISVEENENFFCGIGPLCAHNTIADEGLDISSLSALIMAGGGKSSNRAKQRVGRVIRTSEGKNKALVFDFHDKGQFVGRHSKARFNILKEEEEFNIQSIDYVDKNIKGTIKGLF